MFDLCLSFAGEDRHYVEQVYARLRTLQVSVFYDNDDEQRVKLWGADLPPLLGKIYEHESKYCVIFISKAYVEKEWTNHERQFAIARQLRDKQQYILPARIDDTNIPGLSPTVGYVDCRKLTAIEFADLAYQKVFGLKAFFPDTILLQLAKCEYAQVARSLEAAASELAPPRHRAFILYNLACAQSRRAQQWTGGKSFRGSLLNKSLYALRAWFEHIEKFNLKSLKEAVAYVQADDDLLFLRQERSAKLKPMLERVVIVPSGTSGHCVTFDSRVSTPSGLSIAGDLAVGDEVLSADIEAGDGHHITCRIASLKRIMAPTVIVINETLRCTPGQKLYTLDHGWLEAKELGIGMRIVSDIEPFVQVKSLSEFSSPVEVICFHTDHATCNFFAQGLLCHNIKP